MRVQELFESNVVTEADDMSILKQQLLLVKGEIDKIKERGGSLGHGSILPQYIDQHRRLLAKQSALRDQIATLRAHTTAQQELGTDWKRTHAERMVDPEAKAARNSAAISQGLTQTNKLQRELGGYAGIAQDILQNIDKLTINKTQPIEIEVLADKYGVNVRTIHKWFERPEFLKLRKYMPHMYR